MLDFEKVLKCEVQLKNGNIVNEEIVFEMDNTEEDINAAILQLKKIIKDGFRENTNFNITLGYTIFRGSSIEAIKFILEDQK